MCVDEGSRFKPARPVIPQSRATFGTSSTPRSASNADGALIAIELLVILEVLVRERRKHVSLHDRGARLRVYLGGDWRAASLRPSCLRG